MRRRGSIPVLQVFKLLAYLLIHVKLGRQTKGASNEGISVRCDSYSRRVFYSKGSFRYFICCSVHLPCSSRWPRSPTRKYHTERFPTSGVE
ncbi:hypothetical protein SCHPADRAFT_906942 [Schizopora paradoxa]|uniref:Secreted protein n=1 Tax=Schizopora paradoxa TaxID=27342 RepID=A0A0H2RER5_9AGAM|nr:hypothetical protein SCHPADRAFT_906942 [Schizopora paradoxa]